MIRTTFAGDHAPRLPGSHHSQPAATASQPRSVLLKPALLSTLLLAAALATFSLEGLFASPDAEIALLLERFGGEEPAWLTGEWAAGSNPCLPTPFGERHTSPPMRGG